MFYFLNLLWVLSVLPANNGNLCDVQENTVIYGHTIEKYAKTSLTKCCDLCHETSGCQAFSWWNKTAEQICWLKSDNEVSQKMGLKTGILTQSTSTTEETVVKTTRSTELAKETQKCQMLENSDITDESFAKFLNLTVDHCCDICDRSIKCIAFTWASILQDTGSCLLKSKISNPKPRLGFISGFVDSSKTEISGLSGGSCPSFSTEISKSGEGKCVAFVDLEKTWYDAKNFCARKFPNGQLAHFDRKNEFEKFKRSLKNSGNEIPFWISAKQTDNKGPIFWYLGDQKIPSSWINRNRVSSKIKPTVCLFADRRQIKGTWCNERQKFACRFSDIEIAYNCISSDWTEWSACHNGKQFRKRTNVLFESGVRCSNKEGRPCEIPTCPSSQSLKYGKCIPHCPSYAVKIGAKCVLYSNVAQPFEAAELYCQGLGGHLANLRSLKEQKYFMDTFNSKIKLTRPGIIVQKNVHLGAELVESKLKWTNGDTTTQFTNWTPNWKGNDGCLTLSMVNGFWWTDGKCRNKAFLCEFPIGTFKELTNEKNCGLPQIDPIGDPRKQWRSTAELKETLKKVHGEDQTFTVPIRFKRLVKGFETNNTYWPWYGDLVGCGAALIHPQLVLTAAHCGDNYGRVWFGWVNRFAGTDAQFTDIPAEAVRPGTVSGVRTGGFGGCRGDIEIIKLVRPLPYTDLIRPGCLPDYGAPNPNFEDFYCFATGRGSAENKTFVGQLRMKPKNPKYISGAVQTQSVDGNGAVCLGDSGSSLNCRLKKDTRWFLYGPACGITGCKGPDQAYFTSAVSWRPWIDKTTFDLLYGDP